MKYKSFLIKYGEIGVKGKNRYMFEDALMKQIRIALKEVEGKFFVSKELGRIYVDTDGDYDYEDTIDRLSKVFGIVGICPMVRIESKDYENLKKSVVEYVDEVYPDKNFTFKVDTRRADKSFPGTSESINADLGEVILNAFPEIRVNVRKPDVLIKVEIRTFINIYSLEIAGPGGMPIRRNRLTCSRIHDCKKRCKSGGRIFPCTALYFRESKEKGNRACRDCGKIQRTYKLTYNQFYRYTACNL